MALQYLKHIKIKKTLIILFICFWFNNYAQEFKYEEKVVIGIFEVKDKNKFQIFSEINKWISVNYNSGKTVTQLSDAEAGNIIIKGINEVTRVNTLKKFFYTNASGFPSNIPVNLNHLIEINVKDNKYRVVYRIIDYVPTPSALNYYLEKEVFDCINLNGTPETSIVAFNEKMDSILKMGLKGKSKRELVLAETKPAINEFTNNLISNIKSTMLSIYKSVSATQVDAW